ncbi:T9SS type A sorting domain-containing protein [candidate division KSB1 bacterium]
MKKLTKLLIVWTIAVTTLFPSFAKSQGKYLKNCLNKPAKTTEWTHPNPFMAPDTTLSLAWNNLETPQERTDYLNQKLAIDQTDTITYVLGEWVCHNYATQIHERFFGIEYYQNPGIFYVKNQFNIPVYGVGVSDTSHTEGHSINCVLIGDNPLNFNDWYFFEPQTDKKEDFSYWKNKYPGENLQISIAQNMYHPLGPPPNGYGGNLLIKFLLDETTGQNYLISQHPNLVLKRDINVAVEDERVPIADEFYLGQNYPNHFNPTTTIPFGLKTNAEVDIDIYNILGQEIRSDIVKGDFLAGNYKVLWDGKDNFGRDVSSGQYIYRITAGNFVKSKKMTKLK